MILQIIVVEVHSNQNNVDPDLEKKANEIFGLAKEDCECLPIDKCRNHSAFTDGRNLFDYRYVLSPSLYT